MAKRPGWKGVRKALSGFTPSGHKLQTAESSLRGWKRRSKDPNFTAKERTEARKEAKLWEKDVKKLKSKKYWK